MGTPEFARACLEKLHSDGFDIAAVYTKIDTPKNRGMKLIPSPVKEYAQSVGLPVYQPQSFRDEETVQQLRELKPDLLVVVAYGKILPQAVLDIPKYGAINMHGSILPQLRGSAPVQRSILNHCDEAGVTAMYLSAGMDEGDIIEIRKTAIQPLETSEELMARLAQLAAPLCADTVRSIEAGTAPRIPQDNTRATYAPMLSKEESPIDWNQPLMPQRMANKMNEWTKPRQRFTNAVTKSPVVMKRLMLLRSARKPFVNLPMA
jgi:methionyl-tRNA formyltransferase